jgi:DNA polymerase-3 subunit delta'
MIPSPRANPILLGHEDTERALRAAVEANRLPHALILSGEGGIGKATLAYRLVNFLFAPATRRAASLLGIDASGNSARRVAASSHGDLITIERREDDATGKLHKELVVEDIRRIAPFLRMTASEDGWRVAIIDDASAMNRAGQNALLKILEEPPPRSLLILIAERPGLLLPTIHSRCRMIHLASLSQQTLIDLLEKYSPDLSKTDRVAAARLAGGSIGKALQLIEEDGIAIYREVLRLLSTLPNCEWGDIHKFGEQLASPAAESSYRLFSEFLPAWLLRLVKAGAGMQQEPVLAEETRLWEKLTQSASLEHWVGACEKISHRLAATDHANLDRKLAVWSVFQTLAQV